VSETGLVAVPPPTWRGEFVEAMADLALVYGTPRAVRRVLAWMVVCEPEEQTAFAIQDALGLSAGTVSVTLRLLVEAGLLERVTRPGDRRVYHRINVNGWVRVLEERFRAITEMREVADRAIDASGGGSGRLVDMHDTLAAVEVGVHRVLRECRARNDAAAGATRIRGNA
jgi:DNA-binding transcriptional ArsR family regulator